MNLAGIPLRFDEQVRIRLIQRVVSKFIDLGLFFLLGILLPYPFGPLLGFLYSLLGDGIRYKGFQGQSLGKKIIRLQVRRKSDGKPANFQDSALRNAPVGVATFFALLPFLGWIILVLVGVPLMVLEVYLMISDEKGRRLGDVMGDTEVVDLRPNGREGTRGMARTGSEK
jgi:uncharacterized RDD family membrane protein YckC